MTLDLHSVDASGQRGRKPLGRVLALLGLLLLAGGAHWGALGAQWLSEDIFGVRDAPGVAQGAPGARAYLRQGLSHTLRDGRQVSSLVMASYALGSGTVDPEWGVNAAPAHRLNWLLHLLITALWFCALCHFLPGRTVLAVSAAAAYAAHPLLSGAVVGLAGRGALLTGVFSLLAWFAFGALRRSWLWLPAFWLLTLLAMWAHPTALGLPVVFVLLRGAQPVAQRLALPGLWLAAGGAGLCALVIGAAMPQDPALSAALPAQPLGDGLLLGLAAISRVVLGLILPIGLPGAAADEASSSGFALTTPVAVGATLMLVGLMALVMRAAAGRARQGGLTLALLLAMGLGAALVLPAGALFDPRHWVLLTLPLCAWLGQGAECVTQVARRPADGQWLLLLGGSLAMAALIALSAAQDRIWSDEVTRTQTLLAGQPRHFGALLRVARHERAVAEALREEAAGLAASDPRLAALRARRITSLERALATARRATRHPQGRRGAAAWEQVGQALLALERIPEALDTLTHALSLNPQVQTHTAAVLREELSEVEQLEAAGLLRALARARAASGDADGAADAWLKASDLAMGDAGLQEQAGLSLWGVGRYYEALERLLRAMELARTPVDRKRCLELLERARVQAREQAARWRTQADTAMAAGDIPAAARAWEAALEVDATDVQSRMQAGWWRGHYFGNYARAHQLLDEAEQILEAQGQGPDGQERRWITEKRALLREQLQQENEEAAGEGGR